MSNVRPQVQLSVSYKLTDIGWAECTIRDEKSSCTVTAAYTSDALRHLVLAAIVVEAGFTRASFSFDEEPGEYRWVITSPRTNEIELRIYAFQSTYSEQPDEAGQLLFQTRCRPVIFASAVAAAARELLADLGPGGYAATWAQHPFPLQQLEDLNGVLEIGARA